MGEWRGKTLGGGGGRAIFSVKKKTTSFGPRESGANFFPIFFFCLLGGAALQFLYITKAKGLGYLWVGGQAVA